MGDNVAIDLDPLAGEAWGPFEAANGVGVFGGGGVGGNGGVGGVRGAFFVWASVGSVAKLGGVTLVAALIFGQLTAALILDATGAFGLDVRQISLTRVLAVICVAAGLILSRL